MKQEAAAPAPAPAGAPKVQRATQKSPKKSPKKWTAPNGRFDKKLWSKEYNKDYNKLERVKIQRATSELLNFKKRLRARREQKRKKKQAERKAGASWAWQTLSQAAGTLSNEANYLPGQLWATVGWWLLRRQNTDEGTKGTRFHFYCISGRNNGCTVLCWQIAHIRRFSRRQYGQRWDKLFFSSWFRFWLFLAYKMFPYRTSVA